MTFTNTISVGKDWGVFFRGRKVASLCEYKLSREVASQVQYQARKQVTDHATDKVYEEINPIKHKIHQEIYFGRGNET